MEKEYITIEKDDGTEERMEIISVFKLVESGKNCIIYKSDIDNKYYAASCKNVKEYEDLDTNFTDSEKAHIQTVLDTIYNGGYNYE
ncbi:MAG: hypothetical protein II625_09505 [Bacilli bacterium]|nr:hypothetical protein [Bacilli bacterium]